MGFVVGQTLVQIPALPSTVLSDTLFKFSDPVFSTVNLSNIVGI